MTSDLDIYRAAHELIEQHGDAADIEAAMRADECLATCMEAPRKKEMANGCR